MLENHSAGDFLKLRQEFLRREFKHLNPMQQKAVFKTKGPLLLLAGAGSGKTTVLINRIANIIEYGDAFASSEIPPGITDMDFEILAEYLKTGDEALRESAKEICRLYPAAPWSVIAITFTNKAANELKERLAARVGEGSEDIWAATFHSACVRILRRNIEKLGYSSSFTIYDAADSERVIKDVISELYLNDKEFPPKAVRNIISRAKDSMLSPALFKTEADGNFRLETISKIYSKYQEKLKASNALDFDDIIMLTVELLTKDSEVLSYYQNKFKYVLIDEYQDTNHAQFLLAKLLSGSHGNICVVGDDDQSIYRFRGATIENILSFEKTFEDAEVIRLEQNYRSTGSILNVANSVIKNNQGRHEKKLWTENNKGTLPIVYHATDENDEAAYIADRIINIRASGGNFSDCAVLYRINAQSMQIERAFKRNGIPYRIISGLRFFDRAEVKDMLAYLWVLQNPSDNLRLKRIINVPARKIGAKTIETLEALAERKGVSAFDIIANASEYQELSRSAEALKSFAELISNLRAKLDSFTLGELYDELLEQTGYVRELLSKDDVESRTRVENIMELKSNMLEYENEAGEAASLQGFLEEISLFTDIDRYDADADSVTMMTIHSAKGLEFPSVFICGVEEGLFPGVRSFDDNELIEEERRLFYVASTRARESLWLTYATSRMMFGKTSYSKISRFLKEIDEGLCELCESPRAEAGRQAASLFREQERKPISFTSSFSAPQKKAPAAAENPFSTGDRVMHKVFKEGLIVSANPVGGDVLLEIAFDGVGTKRLLYKAAAQYLTKI